MTGSDWRRLAGDLCLKCGLHDFVKGQRCGYSCKKCGQNHMSWARGRRRDPRDRRRRSQGRPRSKRPPLPPTTNLRPRSTAPRVVPTTTNPRGKCRPLPTTVPRQGLATKDHPLRQEWTRSPGEEGGRLSEPLRKRREPRRTRRLDRARRPLSKKRQSRKLNLLPKGPKM